MEADHSSDAVTKDSSTEIDLNDTFFSNIDNYKTSTEPQNTRKMVKDTPLPRFIGNDDKFNLPSEQENDTLSREQLLAEQHTDPDIIQLYKRAVPPEEVSKIGYSFYLKDGILMRKLRPPEASPDEVCRVVYQLVVPTVYRKDIMALAHETHMAGHLGVNKTCHKTLSHFYWPKLRKNVSEFCKSCHVYQMVGKPNQKIPSESLQPIPAYEEHLVGYWWIV